jgi:hypothetical protein
MSPERRGIVAPLLGPRGLNPLTCKLLIRYQLANVARLDSRHRRRLSQMSLSFFVFARQNMAFESFVALDLTASGNAKSFRGRSIGFYLWHFLLL